MARATNNINKQIRIQPIDIILGPPVKRPYSKSVEIPIIILIAENKTLKLYIKDQFRLNSYLQPNRARYCSSNNCLLCSIIGLDLKIIKEIIYIYISKVGIYGICYFLTNPFNAKEEFFPTTGYNLKYIKNKAYKLGR